ncbi:MAG TPA: sodium:solute symporter [Myxococcales bacterium]|nr:sodium:solute symporter [Myxococcales bacterium]
MRTLDWAVLIATVLAIVSWGVWKTRRIRTADAYLRGEGDRFWTIGLSIMATQASAITFLSMPGQAYDDGLGFIQFYFGLPIAMVLLAWFVLPVYRRLRVYTAYEYLESRFDRKTRQLTAALFLVSRGLAAGLSLYAPALVLTAVLGWPLQITNLTVGVLAVLYTVSGGTRAVSVTQTLQMGIMLCGMLGAFLFVLHALPAGVGLAGMARVAGALGKMHAVVPSLRFDTRYTLWSGLVGGLFVALAYFGTDQSQVQRYLGGASLRESRTGLLFNALIKVPMQFLILMVGIAVVVFHQFERPPLLWNSVAAGQARQAPGVAAQLDALDARLSQTFAAKRAGVLSLLQGDESAKPAILALEEQEKSLRGEARALVRRNAPPGQASDADSIFLTFVLRHFPPGLVGLLLAVIICAALSATASALNALGATSAVDFWRPLRPQATDEEQLRAARLFTVGWGVVAMSFAAFASLLDNLIQAVNILGSIFYGPMLGVFLVGFLLKRIQGTAVFVAALAAQACVVAMWLASDVGFLWYNVAGCVLVIALAVVLQAVVGNARPAQPFKANPGGAP